jgi:hypothetical protein
MADTATQTQTPEQVAAINPPIAPQSTPQALPPDAVDKGLSVAGDYLQGLRYRFAPEIQKVEKAATPFVAAANAATGGALSINAKILQTPQAKDVVNSIENTIVDPKSRGEFIKSIPQTGMVIGEEGGGGIPEGVPGLEGLRHRILPEPRAVIEKQGLVYKGELTPGSGVHMFEHPEHPGKTAALPAEQITPEAVSDKIQNKLKEFNVLHPEPNPPIHSPETRAGWINPAGKFEGFSAPDEMHKFDAEKRGTSVLDMLEKGYVRKAAPGTYEANLNPTSTKAIEKDIVSDWDVIRHGDHELDPTDKIIIDQPGGKQSISIPLEDFKDAGFDLNKAIQKQNIGKARVTIPDQEDLADRMVEQGVDANFAHKRSQQFIDAASGKGNYTGPERRVAENQIKNYMGKERRNVRGTEGLAESSTKQTMRQNIAPSDSMSDPDTRFTAARHEAGHAVASEMLNPGSVESMELLPSGGRTMATAPGGKKMMTQLNADELTNMVARSQAGGLSEPGGTTPFHSSGDMENRANLMSAKAGGTLENLSRLVTGKVIGNDPMLEAPNVQARAQARVNAILSDPRNIEAIDGLAGKLNDKGKLSGEEIRKFLKAVK